MIALYLLACHLVGDFVLQTRWQVVNKLTDGRARFEHCAGYAAPFVVLALVVGHGPLQFYGFPAAVFIVHFATDSRRFYSGLVEHVAYRLSLAERQQTMWREYLAALDGPTQPIPADYAQRMPPNPWPTLPLMIDQTLLVCQLALLGGLMLR